MSKALQALYHLPGDPAMNQCAFTAEPSPSSIILVTAAVRIGHHDSAASSCPHLRADASTPSRRRFNAGATLTRSEFGDNTSVIRALVRARQLTV